MRSVELAIETNTNALRIGLSILAIACAVCAVPNKGFAQTAPAARQAPATAPGGSARTAGEPAAKAPPKASSKAGASAASEAAAAKATGPALSLEAYLDQVRNQNDSVRAAILGEEGAQKRVNEYKLLTRPTLFGSAQYIDSEAETGSAFQGDKLKSGAYQLGLRQVTDIGLTAELTYNYNTTELPEAVTNFGGQQLAESDYIQAGPVLTLTQPLLRGGFGRGIRATKQAQKAQALSSVFRADWETTRLLSDSELAYWRLALARESLAAARENLSRAERLRGWSSQRQRLQLADRSDFLQADSSTLNYRLNLQTAINDERLAARAFNTTRGVASDEVPEQLNSFEGNIIDRLQVPARTGQRSDIKALEQSYIAAQAAAINGNEANKPRLDVFGSIGYNGRDLRSSEAVKESLGNDHPAYTVGLRLEVPLDLGTTSKNREGYRAEAQAAQLNAQRAAFEEERLWNDLNQRFKEALDRYKLAVDYERAQRDKLDFERVRHNRGRTTTFQVITFEQEFAGAELARIRAKNDILTAYAQLKTFAGGN